VAVIDNNGVAEQTFLTGKSYNAVGSGQDGRSMASGNVIGFMKFTSTGKWRCAITESGSHPRLYALGNRTDRGRGGQQILLIFKRSQQGLKFILLAAGCAAELLDLFMHITH